MTGPEAREDRERAAATGGSTRVLAGLLRLGVVATAVPAVLIAIAAVTGVGLSANLTPLGALLAGFSVTLLPALGLASLLGRGWLGHAAGLWGWSLLLLVALPAYFPGQREEATRNGLTFITGPIDDRTAFSWIHGGMELLSLLGPEPRPIAIAERVAGIGEGPRAPAPSTAPPAIVASVEPPAPAAPPQPPRRPVTLVPYDGEGNSMRVEAHVDGPEFGEEFTMIFDTGATLTTLDKRSLELLDIQPDPDAPRLTLHTAAGEMEAQLALVDALWLEDQVVEWVTVAVCDTCIETGATGLLGLNVSSHFKVAIDHDANQIELITRPGRRNRRLDVQPWLDLQATLSHWMDGRSEIEVEVHNRARRGIASTLVEVKCTNETFTVRLDPVPAHGTVTTVSALPWGSQCEQYEIRPLSAGWALDRF